MSYPAFIDADLRLSILQILSGDDDYEVNERVIRTALKDYAHDVSRDKVRAELSWLSEQSLIELEGLGGDKMRLAKLKQRGLDCAKGRVVIDGVARPDLA